MKITIKDKEYTLYFGLDFIESLDYVKTIERDGMSIGMGTQMTVGLLADTRNPKYLVQIIRAALATENTDITVADIKKWIESQEDIAETIDAFLLQLQEVNLLTGMVNWKAVKIQNKNALKKYLG